MSHSIGDSSFRPHTGKIRQLDAARARQLVGLFDRPAVSDEIGLTYDVNDSLTEATQGEIAIQPAATHGHSAAVIGHYSTHLYLHELLRLPLSVARELKQHRGHLYLDKLVAVSDRRGGPIAASWRSLSGRPEGTARTGRVSPRQAPREAPCARDRGAVGRRGRGIWRSARVSVSSGSGAALTSAGPTTCQP